MKILIIKPSSFGDIIQSSPALVALRQSYPDSKISWLVFSEWAQLLDLFEGLDEKIIWDKRKGLTEFIRVIKAVRKEKFDIVLDLQGLARTALIANFSNAKIRIAAPGVKEFSGIFIKEVFPRSKSLNAVERSLETVRYLTDNKMEPVFNITLPWKDEKKFLEVIGGSASQLNETVIGLAPFARGKSKMWPVDYYLELIRLIFEKIKNPKVLVFGSKDEQGLLKHEKAIDLCGKTTFVQLAYYLKRCKAVVGGDTGPVHLANALNVPVITIFGGSDANETSPVGNNVVIVRKDYKCSPCRGRPSCKDYECLADIKPKEVFEKLSKAVTESIIRK